MTLKSENHTLFSGTYPYRPNKGVPPSPRGGVRAFVQLFCHCGHRKGGKNSRWHVMGWFSRWDMHSIVRAFNRLCGYVLGSFSVCCALLMSHNNGLFRRGWWEQKKHSGDKMAYCGQKGRKKKMERFITWSQWKFRANLVDFARDLLSIHEAPIVHTKFVYNL